MGNSPFSPLCGYTVQSYPFNPRPPGELTPREKLVISMVSACGAGAFFQFEPLWGRNKTRKRLKALHRCGLLAMHQLRSEEYRMNVCTPGYFPGLDEVLRGLAFLQLVLCLKKVDPSLYYRRTAASGVIVLNGKPHDVAVVRATDSLTAFAFLHKDSQGLIIVTDMPRDEFKKLTVPCRIIYDTDLLDGRALFYGTGGEPKEELVPAGESAKPEHMPAVSS